MSQRPGIDGAALVRVLALAMILGLVAVATMATAPGGTVAAAHTEDPAIGALYWPPENATTPRDRADLGASVLDASQPLVVGVHPLQDFRIERLGPTRSNVTLVQGGDGTTTFAQDHRPPRGPVEVGTGNGSLSQVSLPVRPADVHPYVNASLASTPPHGLGLSVVAPPGAFDISGASDHEKAEALLDALGLPPPAFPGSNRTLYTTLSNTGEGYTRSHLYSQPGPTCVEGTNGGCQREAELFLECPNCTHQVWVLHPNPADNLTALTNEAITVHGGSFVTSTFAQDGEIVQVSAGPGLNLDPSAVLNPRDARNRTMAHLGDRGYKIPDVPTEVRWRWSPGNASYKWEVTVDRGNASDDNWPAHGDRTSATVLQDAVTGEILSTELLVHDTPPPDSRFGDVLPVPEPAWIGVLTLASVAVLVGRGDAGGPRDGSEGGRER